jgi:putative transposase
MTRAFFPPPLKPQVRQGHYRQGRRRRRPQTTGQTGLMAGERYAGARHAVPLPCIVAACKICKKVNDKGKNRRRRSIRLRGYDYSRPGAYFVTICVRRNECLFGAIVDRQMELNAAGHAAAQCWQAIPDHFPNARLDASVLMPNHLHGILVIGRRGTACRGTACRAPTPAEQFGRPVAGSLPTIVRSFKSAATKRINEMRRTPGATLWQRNYWEHVVRNDVELQRIREYIRNNPTRWEQDRLHPNAGARRAVPHRHGP